MYEALGINRYKETDATSMGPEKMVTLLYEKLVSHLTRAHDEANSDCLQVVLQRVNAAQDIIVELRNALDHSVGGDVSQNLAALYDYMFQENLNFLIDRDISHLAHNLRILAPLLSAWRQIPPGAADQARRDLDVANRQNHTTPRGDGPNPANGHQEITTQSSDSGSDNPNPTVSSQANDAGKNDQLNLVSISA